MTVYPVLPARQVTYSVDNFLKDSYEPLIFRNNFNITFNLRFFVSNISVFFPSLEMSQNSHRRYELCPWRKMSCQKQTNDL